MADHKEPLRKWLRSKNFHPNDIACAIEAYMSSYPHLTDKEVLEVAEKSHKIATDKTILKLSKDEPVIVRYEKVTDIKWVQVGMGALIALVLDMIGVGQWVLALMR